VLYTLDTKDMSQTYNDPEIVESYSMQVRNYTTSTGAFHEMLYSDAVEVKDGQIHFHPSKMLNGKYYNFVHNGKEFLIRKSNNNVIDIFEV
jgi:hypothetical protein